MFTVISPIVGPNWKQLEYPSKEWLTRTLTLGSTTQKWREINYWHLPQHELISNRYAAGKKSDTEWCTLPDSSRMKHSCMDIEIRLLAACGGCGDWEARRNFLGHQKCFVFWLEWWLHSVYVYRSHLTLNTGGLCISHYVNFTSILFLTNKKKIKLAGPSKCLQNVHVSPPSLRSTKICVLALSGAGSYLWEVVAARVCMTPPLLLAGFHSSLQDPSGKTSTSPSLPGVALPSCRPAAPLFMPLIIPLWPCTCVGYLLMWICLLFYILSFLRLQVCVLLSWICPQPFLTIQSEGSVSVGWFKERKIVWDGWKCLRPRIKKARVRLLNM